MGAGGDLVAGTGQLCVLAGTSSTIGQVTGHSIRRRCISLPNAHALESGLCSERDLSREIEVCSDTQYFVAFVPSSFEDRQLRNYLARMLNNSVKSMCIYMPNGKFYCLGRKYNYVT